MKHSAQVSDVAHEPLVSSPELKAQVSFSDHLSSVVCLSVRLSVRLSVCPSICKLFTFSSSSPEPLGQFQPNLAQSILGSRGFKFVQMKRPALFQGETITKLVKIHYRHLKILVSRTTVPISTKLGTKHPWVKGIQVSSNEGPPPISMWRYGPWASCF